MNKKIQILIVVLLLVASFLAGSIFTKKGGEKFLGFGKSKVQPTPTSIPQAAPPPFIAKKTAKPEVKFFVMSFCPYGNQAEAGLEPVYQLFKDKVSLIPRYIISQITEETVSACKQGCPNRVANDDAKQQCQKAIDAGQIKTDADTCVKTYFPYKTADECITNLCNKLKTGTLESLHGQQELNQDIREIIAYNEGDYTKWWKFVSLVNKNCTAQDVDTCWKKQADDAGLNSVKIASLEKSQAKVLAEKEIAEAKKYNASGSPTVYINDVLYNGGRNPEDYKKAICDSFDNPPEECKTVLGGESAAVSGGCN